MNKYYKMMEKMKSIRYPIPLGQKIKKEAKVAKRKFGVEVSFKGDTTTLEQLFGTKPIMSTQMAKFLWAHIRAAKFLAQKDWQPKVGEKVKYQWSKDKKFYLGEITKVTGKLYTVKDAGNPAQVQKVKRNEILKV